jgi:hypothetical protein
MTYGSASRISKRSLRGAFQTPRRVCTRLTFSKNDSTWSKNILTRGKARQLTYERNERILGSCLRMAGDMEFAKDAWKSVTSRPLSRPSAETEIRTESSMLDRSGMAARFLRLAFKINMEQLKLTEREPLEPLPPLTEEENAAYEAESAALWTEPDEAQRQRNENAGIKDRIDSEVAAAVAAEVARRLGPRPTDGPGSQGPRTGDSGRTRRHRLSCISCITA